MKQPFPEVKGKIVDSVEITADAEYYGITISFQDSTSLTFTFEPCMVAFPVFAEWKEGEEKILKEYEPVRSKVSPTEGKAKARLKSP